MRHGPNLWNDYFLSLLAASTSRNALATMSGSESFRSETVRSIRPSSGRGGAGSQRGHCDAGRSWTLEMFTWERVIARMLACYAQALGNG